jgi:hypothetical protein
MVSWYGTTRLPALGVDTITIYGFDFAMYLSETSLASCCCPGGKKSASSSNIKDTFGKPHIASLRFQAFAVRKPFHGQYSDLQDCSISLDEQIAKSKWVEDILPKISYKNVALVEIQLGFDGCGCS